MSSAAGRCVSSHLHCLRWCGFCRVRGESAPRRDAHRTYRWLVLAATSLYLLQECVYAYRARAHMDRLARVMFLLLCHVTSLVKQLVFHADAARIDLLVDGLDDPLFAGRGEAAAAQLGECARVARRLHGWYSGCAVLTCTMWLVFPLADQARGLPVEFPFWVPFDVSPPFAFAAVLLYSYYVTTLVGVANTTMDAFMGTVLYQCTTQLRILRADVESVWRRARGEMLAGEPRGDAALRLLRRCLLHHAHVCRTTARLQDIFGTAILVQFGIGGWILCMAAYKVVSLNALSVEFASMNLFIVCILTELFLYCYYGNEVTHESARLGEALFATRWVGTPPQYQRALLLAGERARRPLHCAAGRVVPLSLDTFLKILKSSYTFYAVLRQTK